MDPWMENNQVLGVRHEGRRTLEALSRIGSEGKASACNAGDLGSISGSGRSPGEGHSTVVFLPGKSHGQRSIEGYSQKDHKELDTTE